MFCPECGIENKDHAKFCLECGSRIKYGSKTPNVKKIKPPQVWNPDPFAIGMGIIIIVGMYIFPFVPISFLRQSVTLAKYAEVCNTPIIFHCDSNIQWIFFGLWFIAIILIIFGLFQKTRE